MARHLASPPATAAPPRKLRRKQRPDAPRVEVVQATGAELLGDARYVDQVRALRDDLLLQASLCRDDVPRFLEFVLRDERRQPVVVPPHQRVGLAFIMAHDRSVNMWPVGHGKTITVAGLTLHLLGKDPLLRGAIISATQTQAAKPVKMVRQYIEEPGPLHLVFPELRPSSRKGDPWTQTEITVERGDARIRDPSLVALGIGGAIAGSRLNWIIVDDILNQENTATKEQRDKVYDWFDSEVLSRLDPRSARIIVVNTAWHPDDLPHRLQALGWATMRMDAYGLLHVQDDLTRVAPVAKGGEGLPAWDDPGLRPATDAPAEQALRLTGHDPPGGQDNDQVLWPERMPRKELDRRKLLHLPHRFNQLYRNDVRDDATARCKLDWIEKCKALARKYGVHGLVDRWDQPDACTFTGVDLAVGQGDEHDETAFFTFAVLPNKFRRILDVEVGRFDGPTIVNKLFEKHQRYNSILRVENNAAQDFIRQFALARLASLPVKAHTTGRAKAHPEHGVEGLFVEMSNGAWLIPNNRGVCPPAVQAWVESCLNYSPSAHTPDDLMACYFAREQARKWGVARAGDELPTDAMEGLDSLYVAGELPAPELLADVRRTEPRLLNIGVLDR